MRDLARRETSSGDHLLQCEPRLSCISRGIQKNARLGSSDEFELRNCLDRKSDHFLTQFEFELQTTEIDDDMSCRALNSNWNWFMSGDCESLLKCRQYQYLYNMQ